MKRNPIAKDVRSPKYRQRIITNKKKKLMKLACRKKMTYGEFDRIVNKAGFRIVWQRTLVPHD